MEQFTQFFINHWILWAAFILILLTLILVELKGNTGGGRRLQPADVTHLINRENAVVLDIRDSEQFITGHIVNAVNIPHTELMNNLNKLKKYQNKPLILVCNSGQHAMAMAKKLAKEGTNQAYVLLGGLQAWRQAGMPLSKGK